MPQLIHATLEPNHHNPDGSVVVLYVDEPAAVDEIKGLCELEMVRKLPLTPNVDDPYFAAENHPTPVSQRAKLYRYEIYPTG